MPSEMDHPESGTSTLAAEDTTLKFQSDPYLIRTHSESSAHSSPTASVSQIPNPHQPALFLERGLEGTASSDQTGLDNLPTVGPHVTEFIWREEDVRCFQVEARGVYVARREDNNFINGTKLLNVAGMTRSRRNGILKSEKIRHIVIVGPMHLKGVWVPFERALELANREKVAELLFPLFLYREPLHLRRRNGRSSIAPESEMLCTDTYSNGAENLTDLPAADPASDATPEPLPYSPSIFSAPPLKSRTPSNSNLTSNFTSQNSTFVSSKASFHPGDSSDLPQPNSTNEKRQINSTARDKSKSSSESSSPDSTDGDSDSRIQITKLSSMVLVTKYLALLSQERPAGSHQQSQYNRPSESLAQPPQKPQKDHKRRKKNRETEDSGDERAGRGSKRRPCTNDRDDSERNRPLACPFNKFDNQLFGPDSPEESYHACATCSFVHIAHLKQHLQRNHYLPAYYCFRCCRRDFSSHSMVAEHLRQEPVCEVLEPQLYQERIGSDLIEALGLDRKNPLRTDRIEYWYKLYNAFFPGATAIRMPSPYYDGPAAEHLARFLTFTQQVLADLLPVAQHRLNLSEELSIPDHTRLFWNIQQEAAQRYLQATQRASMPRLGHTDVQTSRDIPDEQLSERAGSQYDGIEFDSSQKTRTSAQLTENASNPPATPTTPRSLFGMMEFPADLDIDWNVELDRLPSLDGDFSDA